MTKDTIDCTCSGAGQCPLYDRKITDIEYKLCSGKCDYPNFCEPDVVMRRRIRLANESRMKDGRPLLNAPEAKPLIQPDTGPGTKLKQLITKFGIPAELCHTGCGDYAARMDRWGISGCKERREEIVKRLTDNLDQLTGRQTISAAWAAIRFIRDGWFNPLKPIQSLVDESIRLAEEEAKGKTTQ